MGGGELSLTAAGVASVAQAAVSAAKAEKAANKPKIAYEVRPFTKESLEKINLRTSNLIRDYGFLPKRKPNLLDGAELPAKYEPFPPELLGKPVEEIDQYVYEKTFCVVSRRFNKHYVQRFSATRSMFIFAPWNKFRCLQVFLSTNQYFDYVVMLTILVNCVFLAMPENIDEVEYIFLGIYSLEMSIKVVAKGFILNNYTYLRTPWNWLDFLVIFSGYLTSFIEMGNLAGLRTFRVLRALKTIAILPSLKTIINALLNAVKQLAEVMTLTIFCLMVFALFALQVYMGQLRNKCVLEWPGVESGVRNWTEWVLDSNHWYMTGSNKALLCGNVSGARLCPDGYVCLPHVGDNPNYGFTSFDNLLWSMLTTFQLITLDYWENVYNMVVATGGPMHVIFFTIVVFFGSFYLINLMLAVVAMSYEEEAEANNAEMEKEAKEAAANTTKTTQGEECTIRTNPPLQRGDLGGGGSGGLAGGAGASSDACETCSQHKTAGGSREALQSAGLLRGSNASGLHREASGAAGGGEDTASMKKPYVVMKARQVGSEIRSYDLRSCGDPATLDPSFLKNCDSYEARLKTLGRSTSGEEESSKVRGRGREDDQFRINVSLSSYSSASNKSSLNDSGVVGDQELDSVSEARLRLQQQEHPQLLSDDIINCQQGAQNQGQITGGKRPSKIDIPCVVSIEQEEDRNCSGCRKCCLCFGIWLKFQNFLYKFTHDMLFESAVTICIILNTAFLAVEHHGMSEELKHVLEIGNKVFTTFFTTEAVLKLLALSKEYFASGWNIFDLIIVIASLVDLSVESINGISVLRGMRLMRVLKLAQSWTTMKVLLSIIISTLGALGNLTFLLIIVIYIFAVLGMQLFGKTYTSENFYPDKVPRWNFTDFFHSFMMIFRILCGEWIEPLWDCMRAEAKVGVAESCLAIFLPALVMGNFMVLNLFLALLLNSFNCEELKSRKEEVKGESGSIVTKKLNKLKEIVSSKKKKAIEATAGKFVSNGSLLSQNGVHNATSENELQNKGGPSKSLTFEEGVTTVGEKGEEGGAGGEEEVKKAPDPCCPLICEKMFGCCACIGDTCIGRVWSASRKFVHDVVDNPFFEWTILLLIFASSLSLCFEDINLQDNEELMFILKIVNMVFAVLFFIEMLLKWVAFGLWRYFTSAWTCLDFVIVCVSVLSLAIEGSANLTALRSLRTLRALRPLRAISRWQGMKIVVNALMYAIPSIFNVLLVCLVFWLIFSIMGVQFFGGKFYKCLDDEGERLPIRVVNDKFECLEKNFTWVNSKIHFDHVGHAYLALFQVATFEGWMEVMADAVDCREINEQPDYEASKYNYFYFVIFIVCGSFFTLNLFIGVIIDNFNALKKKYEGGVLEMFLTESQKNYYTAMKKLGRKKPQKVIRRPTNEVHALFYDISLSRRFEIAIFVLIFLNMVSMGIEHYNQSRVITFTLEICNALFTTIFSLECAVKIVGLRYQYFTAGWNIFDFVLVIASIVGIVMEDMMEDFPVSPTLLRVVRVFRIGRILRLIKAAKGIRKLLFALIVSLPALFNIGALLALITFIYAIIGMTLFGHVKHRGALNDQVNFETFGRAMQLLFRLTTSAGWNDVLEPLLVTPPYCDPDYRDLPNGNCGHPFVAIVYFVSFIIINYMIVINMYIAIILENFNQAHQEEEIGIVEEDLEMFYTKWAKYDPHATQFINFSQISDFIASLDSPLGIPKPNILALVSFDLPIAKGDKIHCLDVLHSLTKYTLGFVDDGDEDFGKLASQMDEKFKKQFPTRKELEIVSSTREWKRLDNAARIIQRFFKIYVRGVNIEERIDIHTQTKRKVRPAAANLNNGYGASPEPNGPDPLDIGDDVDEDEGDRDELYNPDLDMEWKTQSLPSLGRVSSEQTLESSGDEFAALRRNAPTRMLKSRNNGHAKTSRVTDDDEEELLVEPEPMYEQPPQYATEISRRPKKSTYETRSGRKVDRDIEKGGRHDMEVVTAAAPAQSPRGLVVEEASLERRGAAPVVMAEHIQDRYSYAGYEHDYPDYSRDHKPIMPRRDPAPPRESPRGTPMVETITRMLPQRPLIDHMAATTTAQRRKLPEIPKSAKLSARHVLPPEPHYPSSFHSSFDDGGEVAGLQHHSNPQLASMPGHAPHTVYESYHQQFRQLKRQHSSPMGSRQLPMAPFGHRRTASSSSFGHVPNRDLPSPDHVRGGYQRGHNNRLSYHENPANMYHHDFSSLPRDHRFLSWRRDPLMHPRPPPSGSSRRAPASDVEEGSASVRGQRRSFHYDDRKEYCHYGSRGSLKKAEQSPRRSFDPATAHLDPCDRTTFNYSNEEMAPRHIRSHTASLPAGSQPPPPTPGSPMEALRRRLPRAEWDPRNRLSGVEAAQQQQQQQPPVISKAKIVPPQVPPGARSASPLIAVPILETPIGMKCPSNVRTPDSANLDFAPASAIDYPDPEFYIREAQRESLEEAKAEYNPAAYGMNRVEEELLGYTTSISGPRRISPSRDYNPRWSNLEPDIATDPDWIREREIDREIRERDELVEREIMEREFRESESKRNSRIRSQMNYEFADVAEEPQDDLRYVVTEVVEEPPAYSEEEETAASVKGGAKPKQLQKQPSTSSSGNKKRSPKSPRKSRRDSFASEVADAEPASHQQLQQSEKKEKRHKEKRAHHGKKHHTRDKGFTEAGEAEVNKSSSKPSSKKPHGSTTSSRHDSQRRSIRRQSQVPENEHHHSRKPKVTQHEDTTGGSAIGGADLSDVFDEESQFQFEDSDMKYIEDRSNCRKK